MVLEENYNRIFKRRMFYKICEHAFMSLCWICGFEGG